MQDEKELEKIKENLNTSEIQVPLVVKHNNQTKKRKDKKKKEVKLSDGKLSNAILLCVIALLLFITSYVIVQRVIDSNTKTVVSNNSNDNIKEYTLLKKWESADDELFIFDEEHKFYIYNNKDNIKDDYYSGTYSYKKGKEALEEMGYTEEDYTKIFKERVEENNIYSLELKPDTVFMDGIDKTDKSLPNNIKWWFLLIIKSDGTAIGYNKTLNTRYHLK